MRFLLWGKTWHVSVPEKDWRLTWEGSRRLFMQNNIFPVQCTPWFNTGCNNLCSAGTVPKHHRVANVAWKTRADFCNTNDNTKAEVGLFSRDLGAALGWGSARGAEWAGRSPEPSLFPALIGGSTRILLCTIRPWAQAVFSTGHLTSTVIVSVWEWGSLARSQHLWLVAETCRVWYHCALQCVIERLIVAEMMGFTPECEKEKDHGLSSGAQIFILMLKLSTV